MITLLLKIHGDLQSLLNLAGASHLKLLLLLPLVAPKVINPEFLIFKSIFVMQFLYKTETDKNDIFINLGRIFYFIFPGHCRLYLNVKVVSLHRKIEVARLKLSTHLLLFY
jgi:hypothetical protein